MRHIVFFIAYIYFSYNDFKERRVSTVSIGIYAFIAFVTMAISRNDLSMNKFIDILFSIAFGLIVYMLSYFSGEGIGIADGAYFVINGFLLTLKENIILFLTGLLVAFLIGIFLFLFCKSERRKSVRIPFLPCVSPAIIGYILCIV